MTEAILIPSIFGGEEYISEDKKIFNDYKGNPLVELSFSPPIHVYQVAKKTREASEKLREIKVNDILNTMKEAGKIFADGSVCINGTKLPPKEYDEYVTRLTGLPISAVKESREIIKMTFEYMDKILPFHTPERDLNVYDSNKYKIEFNSLEVIYGFTPKGKNLGIVLPSNHPGVNASWSQVIPIKYPIIAKAGDQEPFTPNRMAKALYEAGLPKDSIYILMGDPETGKAILNSEDIDLKIIFGSEQTIKPYAHRNDIKVFGPGRSKILVDENYADDIEKIVELAEKSMMKDGGRGCINSSALVTLRNGKEIAEELAERLSKYKPKDPLSENALIAAVNPPEFGKRIDSYINELLKTPGAEDLTQNYRKERFIEEKGIHYLLPTIIYCESPLHPIFGNEFGFACMSITEVKNKEELINAGKNSLAICILTDNENLEKKLIQEPTIHKVYNKKPTYEINPFEPHEGSLIDFLYEKKAWS